MTTKLNTYHIHQTLYWQIAMKNIAPHCSEKGWNAFSVEWDVWA
jgi:hypothetical protein